MTRGQAPKTGTRGQVCKPQAHASAAKGSKGPCPVCRRPRCVHPALTTGERCRRNPRPGATVCKKHGANAPQVAAAAEQRQQEAAAEVVVRRLLDDPDAAPIRDPVAQLQRLAGRVANAVDVIGERVNALERIRHESVSGSEQLRAEVAVWERLLGRLQSLLVDMERLNLGERAAQLEEDKAQLLAVGMGWFLENMALSEVEHQRALRLLDVMLLALHEGRMPAIEAGEAS